MGILRLIINIILIAFLIIAAGLFVINQREMSTAEREFCELNDGHYQYYPASPSFCYIEKDRIITRYSLKLIKGEWRLVRR